MKIALYRSVAHDNIAVIDWDHKDWEYVTNGYSQVSEWVNVDFPPLSRDTEINNALQTLQSLEAAVNVEYGLKLSAIKQQRQNLLSLAAPVVQVGGDL